MNDLPKRRLGKTELEVTTFGLGGAWLGVRGRKYSVDDAVATVHRALEQGINVLDTSPFYWESEEYIGIALEAWYQQGGRRDDFILSTKTGTRVNPPDYSAEHTRSSVEESLRLLKTNYVDIVSIHDPVNLEQVLSPDGALAALGTMKEEGMVRHIGIGVRDLDLHREFHETGYCEMSLTYRDFNLLTQAAVPEMLESAGKHDVGVYNGQVIRHGLLSDHDPLKTIELFSNRVGFRKGEASQFTDEEVNRARALWTWCGERDIGLSSLNLAYCLRNPHVSCILLGASSPDEVDEDIAAITASIPESIWTELSRDFGL